MVVQVQERDADQHEHTAQQGVQDVLERGVLPFDSAAPQLDQEIAGDQHQFPEDEEEDQIDRDEDADDGGLKCQQGHKIQFDLLSNRVPGMHHDQGGEQCGEADEQDADAVHREVVADPERRDPPQSLGELHRGGVRYKAQQEDDRQDEFQRRDGQRRVLDQILVIQQPQGEGSEQGEEEQQRQDRKPEGKFL